MKSENQTEGQPQVATTAGLGVGSRLMLEFGDDAHEATVTGAYDGRFLIKWKKYGVLKIMTLAELNHRKMIILPPRPPSLWQRLFTPNESSSAAELGCEDSRHE